MKSCPESKETPKMEQKHSMGFLKKAVAMKKGAKAPKSSPKGKM
ncbi:MAG TPA: hypothetical protein VIX18_09310 [Nitrospirota bacterium]